MAEALGVVASAISLLTLLEHVINSIEKLKGLRRSIQTIPHELEDLIEEIGLVQGVLKTLTPDMFNFMDVGLTERRLRTFQNDLEIVIREVQRYRVSAGRRIGAMKLALMKKEEFSVQRRNLESIKSTLALLQIAYCRYPFSKLMRGSTSFRELRPSIRTEQSDSSQSNDNFDTEYDGTVSSQILRERRSLYNTRRKKRQFDSQEWSCRFRTPLIIIDKLWNVQAKRAFSGWSYTIQIHNIRPNSAPIFQACIHGDTEEVKRLFAAGLASAHDCDEAGSSLLHYAAYNHHLDLCRLLLENGADPDHINDYNSGFLSYINSHPIQFYSARAPIHPPLLLELNQLFLSVSRSYDDPFTEFMRDSERWSPDFGGSTEALRLLLNCSFGDYSELPVTARFERTMALSRFLATPDMIHITMGGDTIEPAAYNLQNKYGDTLLSYMAECMAYQLSTGNLACTHQWRPLLSAAVDASANLHSLSWWYGKGATPLIQLLLVYTWDWAAIRGLRYDFHSVLQVWATELKLAGVDLVEYGAKERLLYEVEDIYLEFTVYYGPLKSRPFSWKREGNEDSYFPICIMGFSYGPEPEDWRIWTSNPTDGLVGEFWEMVEREEEIMPGTWID